MVIIPKYALSFNQAIFFGIVWVSMEDLKKFLIKAKSRGYASDGESSANVEEDSSKSSRFSEDTFSFHDNWFGGEPFGGREVVWKEKKPFWMMVYYGHDTGKAEGLIPFLMKCLSKLPSEMPLRGPREFSEGDFQYFNSWHGVIEEFYGEEKIFYLGEEVYSARYAGGLVDQRKD